MACAVVSGVCALALALPAHAVVYMSKQAALESAFPGADRVESRNLIPTAAEVKAIEQAAKSKLKDKVLTVHVGHRDGRVMGYALIDVHTVRTLPEALLVVLDQVGKVRSVRVLAFHEPTEYKPGDGWFEQFDGRQLEPDLQLARGIHGIAGATLSSRAVTRSVRQALALYRILLEESKSGAE